MIIAIDGHSSTGKSSIAKMLAKQLNFMHIDTGALYRGITLYALRNCLAESAQIDIEMLIAQLPTLDLQFKFEGEKLCLFLNGEDVSEEIREPEIANHVSQIAALPAVRHYLLDIQRAYSRENSVIMDGRDIGTTVFPDADIKFFLTASIEERTKRRHLELIQAGKNISEAEVRQNLIDRDYADSHREISPLVQAEDAILLDNSDLNQEETLQKMMEIIAGRSVKSLMI